jgi:hypothetical protein
MEAPWRLHGNPARPQNIHSGVVSTKSDIQVSANKLVTREKSARNHVIIKKSSRLCKVPLLYLRDYFPEADLFNRALNYFRALMYKYVPLASHLHDRSYHA